MSKDMLGTLVRQLVEMPEGNLGLVHDLLTKMKKPDWTGPAKMFLRKQNPWPVISTWRTLTLGTYKSGKDYIDALARAGHDPKHVAQDELLSKTYCAPCEYQLELVLLRYGDLCLAQDASEDDLLEAVTNRGLALCPPEVGPALFLDYSSNSSEEWLFIGMKGIPLRHVKFDDVFDWYAYHYSIRYSTSAGNALMGNWESFYGLEPDHQIVLCRPHPMMHQGDVRNIIDLLPNLRREQRDGLLKKEKQIKRPDLGKFLQWNPEDYALHLESGQISGTLSGTSLFETLAGKMVLPDSVLDHLLTNQHLIPKSWEQKSPSNGGVRIHFWGTLYYRRKEFSQPEHGIGVRYLFWQGRTWKSGMHFINDEDWDHQDPAVVLVT